MARGYEGQFGHMLNAPYVWIPLAAIFLLGLLDFRRPGGSPTSTCSSCSRSGSRSSSSTRPTSASRSRSSTRRSSTCWCGCSGSASAARGDGPAARRRRSPGWRSPRVFLLGFRIALNIADSGVIDVGYAGVIGADQITHGRADLRRGRVPRRQPASATPTGRSTTTPTSRSSSRCPGAAPGTTCRPPTRRRSSSTWRRSPGCSCSAVRLSGRGARPRARASSSPSPGSPTRTPTSPCSRTPTTRWSPRCSSGRWSSSHGRSPAAPCSRSRRWPSSRRWRSAPLFAAGDDAGSSSDERRAPSGLSRPRLEPVLLFVRSPSSAVVALMLARAVRSTRACATFYDRTVDSQLDRTSPFSIWGQVDGIEWLQTALIAAAAAARRLVAFVPRRRTLPRSPRSAPRC